MCINERMRKAVSFLMAVVLAAQYIPLPGLAAARDGLCEHHAVHENCGYVEAVEGAACSHEHGEDCYQTVCAHTAHGDCGYEEAFAGVACDHQHDDSCGYAEPTEEIPCSCAQAEHTEECGYVPAVPGRDCTHTHGDCSFAEAREGVPCGHDCAAEEACGEKVLNCSHVHDDSCGYAEAVEGKPCGFVCEDCAQKTDTAAADEEIGSGTPDGKPPVLHSLELSATSVTVPGSISFSWSASDDISGISGIGLSFVHKESGKYLVADESAVIGEMSGTFYGTITPGQYTLPGEYILEHIGISDIAGNVLHYSLNPSVGLTMPDAYKDLKFTVVNNNVIDQTPPEIKSISLLETSMKAPGEIGIAIGAVDEESGLAHISLGFYCEEADAYIGTGDLARGYDQETGLYHGTIEADGYDFPGVYILNHILLEDKAENYVEYVVDPVASGYGTAIPDELRSLTFEVTDSVSPDNIAPTINGITFSAPTVMAPGTIEMYLDASDDNSGIWLIKGAFYCEETNKYLDFGEATPNRNKETGKYHMTIEVGQYETSGVFALDGLVIQDQAGNGIAYDRDSTSNDPAIAQLLDGVQFKVINRGADVTTSVSKSDFVETVEDAPDDAYIAADYSGDATLPAEVFEAIAGTNKTIDLISEGITWRFEGGDITEEIKDIDLKVDIQKVEEDSSASGEAIEENLKGNSGVVMKFPENGTLPGKATIQIKVDYAMREYLGTGEGLSVYYYNNQTGELELIAEGLKVINDTYVEFPITHCSYYVLTANTKAATNGTCGDDLTWSFDEDTGALTIAGTGAMYDFDMGSYFAPWQAVKEQILSVEIGEGVTTIGNFAFHDCHHLLQATLPDSLLEIGEMAFYDCTVLQEIILPEKLLSIGGNAFAFCHGLKEVTIPGKETALGINAFTMCNELATVVVESDQPIGNCAFAYNNKLKTVVLKDGVLGIGSEAFICAPIEEIVIPATVRKIADCAFAHCSELKTITFQGHAPAMAADGFAFEGVTADAYYPANDPTWTNKVMQDYGGTIRWIAQENLKELFLFCNPSQPIAVGESVRINLSCNPADAIVDPVYSTSSRSEIVEEDATGVVIRALSAGFASVSVTDTISGKKDEINIRIVEPTEIQAPYSETYDSTNPRSAVPYSFTPKKTGQYVFTLENFDDPSLETFIEARTYDYDSNGRHWVPSDGVLSARNTYRRVYTLEAGVPYLIRVANTGMGLRDGTVFRVGEVVPVTGIDIPEAEKTVWIYDEISGFNVTANVQPVNAVDEVKWSSSDPSVMVIEGIDGALTYVRVIKHGTAVITATCGDYSDSVTVTAKEPPVLTLNTPAADICQLGAPKVYSFTAPSDGCYAASVTAEEEMYIGDGGQGEKDAAGRLVRELKAGDIWYLHVSGNQASDGKSYTVVVEQTAAATEMSLRFEVGYDGNFNVWPVFVPEDAFDPIASCAVSDPEILEEGHAIGPTFAPYRIVKPGEVTVTVTTAGGLTATETVTVSRLGRDVSWLLEEDTLTVSGWGMMRADKSDLWKEVLGKTRVVRFDGGITDLPVDDFSSPSIKEIHLPSSMQNIRYCFLLCENLEKITLQEPNSSYNVVDGVLFREASKSLLLYPAKKAGSSYLIPDGVQIIDFSALQNAVNLETVGIPDSVTSIQTMAFEGCTGLKELVIPESVARIGENVFHGCTGLQSVTVAGNPELYWGVFSDCTALKEITFQGDAPAFGDETFRNVTATAYYPAGNATWTAAVMQDYEGNITWIPYCVEHSFGEWVTEGDTSCRTCSLCGYTETKVSTDAGVVEIGSPEQSGLHFGVDPVAPSEDAFVLVEEALNNAGDREQSVLGVFDITLQDDDGVAVQPGGMVTVRLPLGRENGGSYKVYRVNDDGTLTDMNASRQGSHMVFETDHFSLYVIVEEGHSHSWDAGSVTAEATCMAEGVKTFTCMGCGETEERPLPKDPANHTGNNSVTGKLEATCGAAGYSGDTVCECGVTITTGETVPATGKHTGGVATCMQQAVCTVCGQAYGEKDADNHSFTKYVSDRNATCRKDGTKTAKCDYGCGKTDTVQDRGSKLGHDFAGDTCRRCGVSRWLPDTGDKIMIAVAALAVSGTALLILLLRKKKQRNGNA